jgi:sulfide:quinone oxidoreductase
VNKIAFLTPQFAVTGALRAEDFAAVAAQGFKSVLSNLPDGELRAYPSAAEEAELAAKAKLQFRFVPATKSDVFSDRVVEGVSQALSEVEGPVLAHCASGLRSAIAWAAAAARSQAVDCVIAALKHAGFDLAALQEELEDQRGRSHPTPVPAALDCAGQRHA